MRGEDGLNAGWRRIGTLALYTIPLVLGAAAIVWLGVWMTAHGFFNQLSQEQRRAIYVGAEQRPKSKLRVETPNQGCLKITRVDLDGSTAVVYVQNDCRNTRSFIEVGWKLIAPDGTIIGAEAHYASTLGAPDKLGPGEKAEVVFDGGGIGTSGIALDSRAAAIRFEVVGQ